MKHYHMFICNFEIFVSVQTTLNVCCILPITSCKENGGLRIKIFHGRKSLMSCFNSTLTFYHLKANRNMRYPLN